MAGYPDGDPSRPDDVLGASFDQAAGAQVGSGNVQVNYFYGGLAHVDSLSEGAPREPGDAARQPGPSVTWFHGTESVDNFKGRVEELEQLSSWAANSQIRVIGVNAWGGAGKTALITQWLRSGGASYRPGVRGVFCWS